MRPNYHLNTFQVSILVALFSTADADMGADDWLPVFGILFAIMSVILCVASKCRCGAAPGVFGPCMICYVVLKMIFMISVTLCAASRCRCGGGSRDAADLSHQPPHDASRTSHIYEND
ncbi:hypothetical protein ABVT39_011656 [Epinephelus coioides]